MKPDTASLLLRMLRRYALPAMVVALLAAACAAPAVRQEPPQWPPAPLPAQVAWVKAISDYRDAGVRKGFWRRLADFVAGGDDLRIGNPYGVYVDERGRLFIADNVYITDAAAGVVYRYATRDGALTPFTHALERPTGIAFNRENRLLYVADTTA